MKEATKRSIVRWIHLICAIPIVGYVYSPFALLPDYAPATRFVFLPAMLLSGLWMWKGHVLRRWISTWSAGGGARTAPNAFRRSDELSFEGQERSS